MPEPASLPHNRPGRGLAPGLRLSQLSHDWGPWGSTRLQDAGHEDDGVTDQPREVAPPPGPGPLHEPEQQART